MDLHLAIAQPRQPQPPAHRVWVGTWMGVTHQWIAWPSWRHWRFGTKCPEHVGFRPIEDYGHIEAA